MRDALAAERRARRHVHDPPAAGMSRVAQLAAGEQALQIDREQTLKFRVR